MTLPTKMPALNRTRNLVMMNMMMTQKDIQGLSMCTQEEKTKEVYMPAWLPWRLAQLFNILR